MTNGMLLGLREEREEAMLIRSGRMAFRLVLNRGDG